MKEGWSWGLHPERPPMGYDTLEGQARSHRYDTPHHANKIGVSKMPCARAWVCACSSGNCVVRLDQGLGGTQTVLKLWRSSKKEYGSRNFSETIEGWPNNSHVTGNFLDMFDITVRPRPVLQRQPPRVMTSADRSSNDRRL